MNCEVQARSKAAGPVKLKLIERSRAFANRHMLSKVVRSDFAGRKHSPEQSSVLLRDTSWHHHADSGDNNDVVLVLDCVV
jgi:hypothetical protein